MKVLVTGGAGFIGSHTVDALLKKGYEVRILDSLEYPVHRRSEKPMYIPNDVDFIVGDVRNHSDMEKALTGVDCVFHLAAYQGYLTDFSKFAEVNDKGTALLYETIVNRRFPIKKVVVASSQAVYGEGKYECPEHGIQYPAPRPLGQLKKCDWELKCTICNQYMKVLTTNETSVRPHNQYAVSKYSQELYALTLGRRFEIPTVAMRYSITQGPRQSFSNAYSGILRIFAVRLLKDQTLTMYEDGNQLRDYIHIADVVEANLLVLESQNTNYEVYNVGGKRATSVKDFAQLLIQIAGKTVGLKSPGEFRYGDVRHIISDISNLQKLGWQPHKTLEQNIKDYFDWIVSLPEVTDFSIEAVRVLRQHGVIQKGNH